MLIDNFTAPCPCSAHHPNAPTLPLTPPVLLAPTVFLLTTASNILLLRPSISNNLALRTQLILISFSSSTTYCTAAKRSLQNSRQDFSLPASVQDQDHCIPPLRFTPSRDCLPAAPVLQCFNQKSSPSSRFLIAQCKCNF